MSSTASAPRSSAHCWLCFPASKLQVSDRFRFGLRRGASEREALQVRMAWTLASTGHSVPQELVLGPGLRARVPRFPRPGS